MKTILIDCRFAAGSTGLGRYTRELVSAMLALHSSNVVFKLLVRSAEESWIPASVDRTNILTADVAHYSLAEQRSLPSVIRASGADLFFSTHFNVPFLCPIPFVATIHDLILHRFPNNASFLKRAAYKILIARTIKRAQSLIAVSHFTAAEIRDLYGPSAQKKTVVITEGVDEHCMRSSDNEITRVRDQYSLSQPYFLYVGNAKEHKNVQLLIDAFAESGRTDAELVLVTHGAEVNRLEVTHGVRVIDAVSDHDLYALYSGAMATVTASVYEGYCLPIVESLACGTPVIAPDRSATAETAAGHTILLEPTIDAYAAAFAKNYQPIEPYRVGEWRETARATLDHLLLL